MKAKISPLILPVIIFLVGCQQSNKKLTAAEAQRIAKEAYIYGFPLVMNYKTLYVNAIDKNSGDYKGEINTLSCNARVYTPDDKAIVTPNSDTPYCMFWSDIRDEPVVFSVPEVDSLRYYSFQFIDLYTHNFSYIGSLTKGNKAGKYLVAQESWEGEIPEGITEVIQSETGIFFTIVRTQLFDADDLDNVENLQEQYQLQTLSEYLGSPATKKEHSDEFPEWVEGEQFSEASFKYLDAMLKLIGNPIEKEKSLWEDFAKLELGTAKGYSLNNFDEEIQNAIKQGVKDGFAEMEAFIKENSADPLGSANIFGSRDFLEKSAKENYDYDDIHLIRAVGAHLGIYGNSASEAIYPAFFVDAEGNPLDASKGKYTLTFAPNQMPPVKSFWSLTMYDGKTQLLVHNPLDKYLVNSTMKDAYVSNDDGSITFYIQHDSPGENLEANWLPAPNGSFYCIMRLYGPTEAVIDGTWVSPKMVKQNI
ncbi:DUF1254 domain-containing protein [Algoriphagus sp. NG3]|uniref:DUF1254 domain-containing protein n=1 Tax=Algoriphagus sp. NG3 TaxID=3097546 RepID=UPI002A837634|nr:DUF1254 domain-containing protein [Algoriphagus sp. NG3]WPR75194.1 DUF1254 domain-containing protein [Algoriphagus sp. NG3]